MGRGKEPEVESDDNGEDLSDTAVDDYDSVSFLDRYDKNMIDDDSRVRPLSGNARRLAEEAMQARDERNQTSMLVRGFQSGSVSQKRAPRAMDQVNANQEGLIELNRLARKLKASSEILGKAADTLRRAYTGLKCFEQTSKECLPAACMAIGAKLCKKSLDRELILKHSNIGQRDYGRTLGILCRLLGMTREVTINELCAEFSCNAIKASARQMLEVFKREFWASLTEERRDNADFSRPVFAVAAVILTAERHKAVVKIPDRKEMMQATGVSEDDYKFVRDQMTKLCTPSLLEGGTAAKVPATPPAAVAANLPILSTPVAERGPEPPSTPPTVTSRSISAASAEPNPDGQEADISNAPSAPQCAVRDALRRRGALPRQRTVLQAHAAPALRAPTGFNTVCADGLPSVTAKGKRKLSAEQEEAAKKLRTEEYQRWKASVLAGREQPQPAPSPSPALSEVAALEPDGSAGAIVGAEGVVGRGESGAGSDSTYTDGAAESSCASETGAPQATDAPPWAEPADLPEAASGPEPDRLRQTLAAAAERRMAAAAAQEPLCG